MNDDDLGNVYIDADTDITINTDDGDITITADNLGIGTNAGVDISCRW